ncbi:MAG: hypothetical protein ACPG05_05455, partial [Bdellovibrionales bacterium]
MKINYISGSLLPSSKANSVHVMKMCQALSRHQKSDVTLYGKSGSFRKNVYAHYSVKPSFAVVRSWFGKLPLLSGALRLITVLSGVFLKQKPDAYYGRDAMGLLLLSFFKIPLFYESHQIPQGKFENFILKKLLRSPYLKGAVVISKALEEDFEKHFSFKKPLLIAHDGADIPNKTLPKIPQKSWAGRKNILQVGYAGSLHKGKGMELIYDIAK